MNSLTPPQPFSRVLFRRRISHHPRIYIKEQPSYRYTRMVLTQLGFASVALVTFIGIGLLMSLSILLK